MLRYNIFNMIHKALRAMLYDTALTLQQTYFADTEDAAAAFKKMNDVIHAFEQHGHHEDVVLMPYIESKDPATIASFEKEHIDDHHMGNYLKHLQNIYSATGSDAERIMAGSAISKAFRDYMIFNLQHMQREEMELNKLLWENYNDAEILEMNTKIVSTIPPEEMAVTAQWFLQGINKKETTDWLTSVKENAPDVVFEQLFQLTETFLPERFRQEVRAAVNAHRLAQPVF